MRKHKRGTRKRTKRHSLTPILQTDTMVFHRLNVKFFPGMDLDGAQALMDEVRLRGGSLYAVGSGLTLEVYETSNYELRMNVQYEARPQGRA